MANLDSRNRHFRRLGEQLAVLNHGGDSEKNGKTRSLEAHHYIGESQKLVDDLGMFLEDHQDDPAYEVIIF